MIEDILHEAGNDYVRAIRDNLASTGTDATGETSKSVGYEVYQNGDKWTLNVYGGRPFFPTVETGSKPSKKKPSPKMIDKIKTWAGVRGILASPWAVAKNILKYGSKLWQRGGRRDIYSNVAERSFLELPRKIVKAIPILLLFSCSPEPVMIVPSVEITLLDVNDKQATFKVTPSGNDVGIYYGFPPDDIQGSAVGENITITLEPLKSYFARGYSRNGAGTVYSKDLKFYSACPTDMGGDIGFSTVLINSGGANKGNCSTVTGVTTLNKIDEAHYGIGDASFGVYGCAWNNAPAKGVVLEVVCGKVSIVANDQFGFIFSWDIVSVIGDDMVIEWVNSINESGRSTLTKSGGWPELWQ